MRDKPLKQFLIVFAWFLVVGTVVQAAESRGGSVSGSSISPPVILNPSTDVDAIDINMSASATGNAIAVKNSAGATLFAVPGGADSSHNSSQVSSIAAIPIDTVNDAFFANIPSTDTAGNCYVCQDNSVTQGAIAQTGQFFSSPGATTTDAFKVNLPTSSIANMFNGLLNNVQKVKIDSSGSLDFIGPLSGIGWASGASEAKQPTFEINAEDQPGVLADTSENFGSTKFGQAVVVTAAYIFNENAAASCTTLPIYELNSNSSYNSTNGSLVSSCTPISGTAVGARNCTVAAPGTVAQNNFIWWNATTAASACAAKFLLVVEYRMQ